jgi:DNA replication licensing factor MCM3
MIRLATAHARARLSKNVEIQDANCAVELVQFAYFKKVLERPKKRKREHDGEEEEEEDEEDMDVDEDQEIKPPKTRRSKKERKSDDPYEFEEESDDESQTEIPKTPTPSKTDSFIKLTEERLKQFRSFLFKEFRKTHAQSLPLQQIYESAEKETELNFTKQEIESALNTMQEDLNQIFVSNNIVILV